MVNPNEIIFDVVTRSALLVQHGRIYRLDGPFENQEDAKRAAAELERRLADAVDNDPEDH